jgi:hypothetical protein
MNRSIGYSLHTYYNSDGFTVLVYLRDTVQWFMYNKNIFFWFFQTGGISCLLTTIVNIVMFLAIQCQEPDTISVYSLANA